MLSRVVLIFTVGLFALPALARPAYADPVRLAFEMDVRATFGDLADIFGTSVAVGDTVSGELRYDTSLPDRQADPLVGDYRGGGAMVLNAGRAAVALPLEGLFVFDQAFEPVPTGDDVFGAGVSFVSFPGFEAITVELSFRGSGRTGDGLPTAAEALAAFSTGSFRLIAFQIGGNPPFDRGTHEVLGIARLLDEPPAPVPEPGTLLLVGCGAALMGRRAFRSRA
jgi:hypothetical protein